ncbi:MAG: hypothetical protein KatS3mg102_0215 [Planctomycetota bacterium]|nr:MAG: hypothetical protein KatS3mg102_0215 [Planctomycetota bacterium]
MCPGVNERPQPPPRYAPELPLPPYAFVAPFWPHPEKDARGHSYGRPAAAPRPLEPARWREHLGWRHAADLFNHGYYWEAHEVWEQLWHAAGRTGVVAELCKGLIKLAAAGIKVRQGRPRGVRRHALAAARHLGQVRAALREAGRFAGLDLGALIRAAERTAAAAGALAGDPRQPVEVVFDWRLELEP